jgi:MFS family permease
MDTFFESTGALGTYQIGMIALMGGISSLSSMCIFATVFTAAESDFICNGNSTLTEEQNCNQWSNITSRNACSFDKTHYDETIITEWNLICDRKFLVSITQTCHMVGAICSFFTGYFGDRYGRRKTTLFFLALLCLTLTISELGTSPIFKTSIMTRYIVYTVGQFLIGMLVNCCYCIAYVLLLELTTSKYRTTISNINSYIYVLGELNVMFGYYLTKNWHYLNWIIIVYSIVGLILAFIFLPESPQWLISMQRYEEAYKLLYQIAKVNRRKKKFLKEYNDDLANFCLISSSIENDEDSDKNSDDNIIKKNNNEAIVGGVESGGNSFMKIFYPKKVFIKTIILIYVWNTLNLLYYGISLGITTINAINPYYMFFLSCIAEIVGVIICRYNDIYGRRRTFSGFLIVSAFTCLIVALIPHDFELTISDGISLNEILIVIFALIGKGAVSGAYNIIYIYTSELYTTNVRNTAVLFLVCVGSVGSFVAPQINFLRTLVWAPLPYMIFAISALIACFCVIFLPETKGKNSI